ncbi:hypothetical protein CQU01_08190 [Cerasibacillus quisquiliarum]|uniref:Uncharacterized protein n=1 Tax=Cerasibacillus quisquiliarum TaxID=227865 RepID=A0A511UXR8_9BACI|nr:hypothetical protein CQU01_08190 [Cerasibacillus quisquiliarum]
MKLSRKGSVERQMLFLILERSCPIMLKRLREKLKERLKDLLGRGRVPTTYKNNNGQSS